MGKCSICGKLGHNKNNKKFHPIKMETPETKSVFIPVEEEPKNERVIREDIPHYPRTLSNLLKQLLSGKSVSSILTGLTETNRGHVGEAILRLMVMFGIDPNNPVQKVSPLITNPSTKRLSLMSPTEIESIISSGLTNSGGSDKIDVAWEQTGKIYACSSKFGKKTIKSVSDLQISDMLTDFTHGGGYTLDGKKIEPINVVGSVLVYDGEQTQRVKEKAGVSNRVSVENMNIILDIHHLERAVSVMREKCKECDTSDIHCIIRSLLSTEKPPLKLRFHQKLICKKAERLSTDVLIGALPRSGKTFIGAYLSTKSKQIIVITTRPSETRDSWNKVFRSHCEFASYSIMNLNASSVSDIVEYHRNGKPIVVISSLQFLKGDADTSCRTILEGLTWDIALLDEIHEGGSTILSDKTLDRFLGSKCKRVMLTASYQKPVEYYNVPPSNCIYWDLEDSKLMRSWGKSSVLKRLCEKYGEDDVLSVQSEMKSSGETDATIRSVYESAPRLGILTTSMQVDVYAELSRTLSSPDNLYGFSMRSLFMTNKSGKKFQNQTAVDTFLSIISGSDKVSRFPRGDMSMFARIRRNQSLLDHRSGDEFMTQMWFLPYGVGQTLDNVKRLLKERIQKNSILRNYTVLFLDSGMKDMVGEVRQTVVDARASGKYGVILLTGNVGSLGVSLPDVDVAFLLHDFTSADMTYQQMMRVLTEADGKRCGLVVDFNIWRILETLDTYASNRCGTSARSTEERIQWYISHLVDIDVDMIECVESPTRFPNDTLVSELTKHWRRMIENTGKSLSVLSRIPCELDDDDQSSLERIAKPSKIGKDTKVVIKTKEQDALPDGVERVMETKSGGESKEDDTPEEKTEKKMKANLNEVLSRIIPELSLMTDETDLLKALEKIIANDEQREAMNEFLTRVYS